ncbi:hypothetical protein [Mycobacterium stomatepiae]|uniref:Uncharacterized protein n=1 Tax=Mycobacterium stomatepiae TaxID=470076 RepID=A0A7I7Q310_9MYCO|nr:hypothetical protein [Mycobacterium stomatepiae]MCV7165307.1 hypothetical protein [Mycobacterium stomatepiae]BBY20442.1 hypothetical protein MSTO_06470 [Mycobacterium stomatepiae]
MNQTDLMRLWWAEGQVAWTRTGCLGPVGAGIRVLLENSGFDLNYSRLVAAFDPMGPGWRDVVLPRIAEPAARA